MNGILLRNAYFALQTRLLLLNIVDLNNKGLDMFFLLLDASGVLATQLFNLLSPGGGLSLELGAPLLGFTVRLHQLPLQVQTGLGFFFQLHADGLKVDLNLKQKKTN